MSTTPDWIAGKSVNGWQGGLTARSRNVLRRLWTDGVVGDMDQFLVVVEAICDGRLKQVPMCGIATYEEIRQRVIDVLKRAKWRA